MKLPERVELLHRSSERLMEALKLTRDRDWWAFMSREVWIHLKRTIELLWAVMRKKE